MAIDDTAEARGRAGDDPVVVIGLAVHLADGVQTPQALWDYLIDKRSALKTFPEDRLNISGHHGTGLDNLFPLTGGHFLEQDISRFDGPFFGMTPNDLASTDPQQRLALEVSYQAFENAGISLENLAGTKTSVYVGGSEYDHYAQMSRDPDLTAKYRAAGTYISFLSNRISWFYDLVGPSMTIDTACSSSLVALHLACQSLLIGETKMSLVGGTNLFWNPDGVTTLNNVGALSADSLSHSFDSRADGFSRGEGIGFVVLKRLSDAIRDGDTIRAVIRSSATNQNGKNQSIAMTSVNAQVDLLQMAYKNLDKSYTRFIEAHGTGTKFGDATEAEAIATYFQPRADQPLIVGASKSNFGHAEAAAGVIGLIKTILVLEHGIIPPNYDYQHPNPRIESQSMNLMFPRSAIKWPQEGLRRASVSAFGMGGANAHVVLDDAFHYLQAHSLTGRHATSTDVQTSFNQIASRQNLQPSTPPSIASTLIDGNHANLNGDVQSQPTDLNHESETKLNGSDEKGTSDFEPQLRKTLLEWQAADVQEDSLRLVVLSAADKAGLQRLAQSLADHLEQNSSSSVDYSLDRLAHTLFRYRSHLPWRSFFVAGNIAALRLSLGDSAAITPICAESNPRVAFVFTGQGATWPKMGTQLLLHPIYRDSISQADEYLKKLGATWSVKEELSRSDTESQLSQPLFAQAITTVLQVALIELLRYWGVHPSVCVGHSSGEIATAYAAGYITRESAWSLAFHRGQAVNALSAILTSKGTMMAAGLSRAEAEACITSAGLEQHLCVACVNSPKSVTISGNVQDISTLEGILRSRGTFVRRLNVDIAYHSRAMESIRETYQDYIKNTIQPGTYRAPMISSVLARIATQSELLSPEYWVNNLVSPVLFEQAISQLHRDFSNNKQGKSEIHLIIEVGPHSSLKGPMRDTLAVSSPKSPFNYVSILKRGETGLSTVLQTVGEIHGHGVPLDLQKVNFPDLQEQSHLQMVTDLPPYSFDHSRRYWLEGRLNHNYRFRTHASHPFLGHAVLDWNPLAPRWQNFIGRETHPWVQDHVVRNTCIYPGAGMLVMAVEATRQLHSASQISGFRFRDVFLEKALVIPQEGRVETQFVLELPDTPNDPLASWYNFQLLKFDGSACERIMRGSIAVELSLEDACNHTESTHMLVENNDQWRNVSTTDFYRLADTMSNQFGPAFKPLSSIRTDKVAAAKAICDIMHWQRCTEEHIDQSFIVHPAALDGMLQIGMLALKQIDKSDRAIVPIQVPDLWMSARLEDYNLNTKQTEVDLSAQSSALGLRAGLMNITSTAVGTNIRLLHAQVKIMFLEESTEQLDKPARKLCYGVEWKPDVDLIESCEVQEYCTNQSQPSKHPEKQWNKVYELCWLATKRVIQKNSMPPSGSHLQKYIEFLMQHGDTVFKSLDHSIQTKAEQHIHDDEYFSALCDELNQGDSVDKLVSRVSRNLTALVEAKISPQELLWPDGLIDDYYRHASDLDSSSAKLISWLDLYAHKNPNARILEVGAGTGGSTGRVLQALSQNDTLRVSEYYFTDVSSSFFENAKEKFAPYNDRIQYGVLDIERTAESDTSYGKFDLIFAAAVVHATENLEVTLRKLRSFLKDNGKLVLYELTTPDHLYPGIVFGLFPGWWSSQEAWRKTGALATISQWTEVLRSAGFAGLDLTLDGVFSSASKSAIMIAGPCQTDLPNGITGVTDDNAVEIIISRGSQLQLAFAERLRSLISSSCNVRYLDEEQQSSSRKDCIFLPSLDSDVLCNQSKATLSGLRTRLRQSRRFIWVYNSHLITNLGPINAGVIGLIRAATAEYSTPKFVALGLSTIEEGVANLVMKVMENTATNRNTSHQIHYQEIGRVLHINRATLERSLDTWISERNTPRQPSPRQCSGQAVKLAIGNVGMLDSLHFVPTNVLQEPIADSEIQIEVRAAGVSFSEVLMALGRLSETQFTSECAGVVLKAGAKSGFVPGDRVACDNMYAIENFVRCDATGAVRLPDWMSFTEGASWMFSFLTAYYGMITRAGLSSGDGTETVLIHSGAGALGQACIQIALMYDLEIFTTVGSTAKRTLVKDKYGIPDDHIFSSRNGDFEKHVMLATSSRGVDIVVNSLSGQLLQASWRCLAPEGRFIEMGKADIYGLGLLPMGGFKSNRSFLGVDLGVALKNPRLHSVLQQSVMNLFIEGKLKVFEITTYPLSQVAEAFRKLASGQSVGKVVLECGKDEVLQIAPQMTLPWQFNPSATYVIGGAFGGIGRSLSTWMVTRGAKYLILLGRQGAQRPESQRFVKQLERMGTTVLAQPCDISKPDQIDSILEAAKAKDMPPIRGCIQGAMVLEDASLEAMTPKQWNTVVEAKVHGTWHLHEKLPRDLDFFVMLSSGSGVVGIYGQSNYGVTSTYMDGLADYRISKGERAVSLDLGRIMSVGYIAERGAATEQINIDKFVNVEETELLATVEFYCAPAAAVGREPRYDRKGQMIVGMLTPDEYFRNTGQTEPVEWMMHPFWSSLWLAKDQSQDDGSQKNKKEETLDIASALRHAKDFEEAAQVIQNGLAMRLKQLLGLQEDDIHAERSIARHGIDSLHAVELRTWMRRKIDAEIEMFEFLGESSMAELARNAAERSSFVTSAA